ncbi:MAG: NfeD family protein [Candidatus Zixiibacteriota bacterium]
MPGIVWIWVAAAVVFLILELATPTLIFACFVAGSLAGGVGAYVSPENYYMQASVFALVSIVLLPFTRILAKRITKESPQKSNVDALIGKVGLVTKAIDKDLGGQVQLEGEVWTAVADEQIAIDSKVTVLSISGTKVHVEKKQD